MKPVIIYSLHRTKATAAITGCKRSIMNMQPFTFNDPETIEKHIWLEKTQIVNNPNSVSRVRGSDINNCKWTTDWYNNYLNDNNYDIFIVERFDRLSTILSFFTSKYFGFNKFEEIQPYNVTVSENLFQEIEFNIKNHINYYPKFGSIVTFETLPTSHFDKHIVSHSEQKSKDKFKYLINLDECIERSMCMIEKYKKEWDEKIKSIKNHLF